MSASWKNIYSQASHKMVGIMRSKQEKSYSWGDDDIDDLVNVIPVSKMIEINRQGKHQNYKLVETNNIFIESKHLYNCIKSCQ